MIDHCASSDCGFKCCSFGTDGHIVILPHELDNVDAESVAHLRVIDDDYIGGKKVKCEAIDCKTCDYGYKPIMCRAYPLWVKSVSAKKVLRSRKCPLSSDALISHKEYVLEMFTEYRLEKAPFLDLFLGNAWVDNYERL